MGKTIKHVFVDKGLQTNDKIPERESEKAVDDGCIIDNKMRVFG